MRAGLAGLRLLTDDFYKSLNQKCGAFVHEVNRFLTEKGINAHLVSYRSMMSIRFRKAPVRNYTDALEAAGGKLYSSLFNHLLNAGIYWPPADLEAFFISCMHTKKDLNYLADQLKNFFEHQKTKGVLKNETISIS
jgi:glutamate-1-semialdehyde 2,1-aminomutase